MSTQQSQESNHIAFAQKLKDFCQNEQVAKQAEARGNTRFLTRNPGKWVHGPLVLINGAAKVLGAEGVSAQTAAILAQQGMAAMRKRETTNQPSSGRSAGQAALDALIAHVLGVVFEKTVQLAGDLTTPQVAKHDLQTVQRGLSGSSQKVFRYNKETQNKMAFLRDQESLSQANIVAAASLLQIVLYHTSNTVDVAVKKLPDAAFAKLTGWTFGSAGSLGTVVGIGLIPVMPGIALAAAGVGCIGGLAFSGFAIYKNVVAGKDWTKTKKACKELEINLENVDKNIRAFCSFLGFLFMQITQLEDLNDEEYIETVRRLNESLPRDIEQWSDPAYVSEYIEIESRRLDGNMKELVTGLKDLGIQQIAT